MSTPKGNLVLVLETTRGECKPTYYFRNQKHLWVKLNQAEAEDQHPLTDGDLVVWIEAMPSLAAYDQSAMPDEQHTATADSTGTVIYRWLPFARRRNGSTAAVYKDGGRFRAVRLKLKPVPKVVETCPHRHKYEDTAYACANKMVRKQVRAVIEPEELF